MDYEQINPNQPIKPPGSYWKWIIVIAAILAIVGFVWYLCRQFYILGQYPSTAQPQAQEQVQPGAGSLTRGDTTSDISKDLNQTPDDSSVNKELDSLDQNLQNF